MENKCLSVKAIRENAWESDRRKKDEEKGRQRNIDGETDKKCVLVYLLDLFSPSHLPVHYSGLQRVILS